MRISAEQRNVLEPQFLMQAALGSLDRVLDKTAERLNDWSSQNLRSWRFLGNLAVDPPLSFRAKASIRRLDDEDLGLAILGLSAGLSALFRMITTRSLPKSRYVGAEYPEGGKPQWELVADFVNDALPAVDGISADDIKQRWHAFRNGRTVRLHNWAREGVREPQLA